LNCCQDAWAMTSNKRAGKASHTTNRFSSGAAFGPNTPARRHMNPAKMRPNTGSNIGKLENTLHVLGARINSPIPSKGTYNTFFASR